MVGDALHKEIITGRLFSLGCRRLACYMAREQKILVLERQKGLRLFLSAIVYSVNKDASVLIAPRPSEACRLILKHKDLSLLIIGLESYSDARKEALLDFLKEHSPRSSALLVYESKRPPAGMLVKSRVLSCRIEVEGCRKGIARLLKSAK